MILVIDNYDSFTWNLVHYLMEMGAKVEVVRNDAMSAGQAISTGAQGFLISPGPCTPNEAGISLDLVGAAADAARNAADGIRALDRLVIMNVPHPACFADALRRSAAQRRRSWYMWAFQLPWLPEAALTADGARAVKRAFLEMAIDKSPAWKWAKGNMIAQDKRPGKLCIHVCIHIYVNLYALV
jgi:hypothetical protein